MSSITETVETADPPLVFSWFQLRVVLKTQEDVWTVSVLSCICCNCLSTFVLLSVVKVNSDLLRFWIPTAWTEKPQHDCSSVRYPYSFPSFSCILLHFKKGTSKQCICSFVFYSFWTLLEPKWNTIHYVFTKLVIKYSLLKHPNFNSCQPIL